jgi:hypothetical protein
MCVGGIVFLPVRIQKEPAGSEQEHPHFVDAELQRRAIPVHIITPCTYKINFKNRPSTYRPTSSKRRLPFRLST